jgi:bifunctional non-homologous end joining protein LigD
MSPSRPTRGAAKPAKAPKRAGTAEKAAAASKASGRPRAPVKARPATAAKPARAAKAIPAAKAAPKAGPAAKAAPKAGPAAKAAPKAGPAAKAATARPLQVRVSNPDKVFWPDEGYTKLDLIRFYAEIFPTLVPYLRDRPLSLERCPDGLRGNCFYQKEKPAGLPDDTPTVRIRHETGEVNYVVGGKRETQLALANLGCIAIHVWGSRAAAPRKPDWVCFDLDPASGRFADAARAGLRVKEALDALGLTSFPKTSGARGLHVFVPIKLGSDTDEVRDFAGRLGEKLAHAYPREMTVESRIAARGDRVYLDSFRNGFGQTVVSPYSVRRRPKAPVSTPLDWSEVTPELDPSSFNIANFSGRLAKPDPWADFFKSRQALGPAMRALSRLG